MRAEKAHASRLEEALSCVRGLKATVRIREMRSGSAARR